MANIAKEKIAEIEKLAKVSTRKIDGYTKDIEKIDAQIKELNNKKKSLTNSIVSERNATVLLNDVISQMKESSDTIAELLYIGLAGKYGLAINDNPIIVAEEKEKPVEVQKQKRRYNRRSKEEIRAHREWTNRIQSLYKGKVDDETAIVKRAYSYMTKRYGVNPTEEKKLLFGDEKIKTMDAMFVFEKVKPVHKGLTYDCVEAVMCGKDKE